MKFEWDERKKLSDFAKHGFDFADGYLIFNMPDEQTIRFISLRKALSYESRYYEQYVED